MQSLKNSKKIANNGSDSVGAKIKSSLTTRHLLTTKLDSCACMIFSLCDLCCCIIDGPSIFTDSRAKSNQATTETSTEVIFAEPPVINVTESGVIENTTEKITIKCQGSGKPRPTFQLNLFYDYGPDLIKTGLYQVKADFFCRIIVTPML